MASSIENTDYELIPLPWQKPVALAEKIRQLGYMAWLDSTAIHGLGDGQQYDVLTASPEMMIYQHGSQLSAINPETNCKTIIDKNPFNFLKELHQQYTFFSKHKEIPFTGGLLGYWGYELNYLNEPIKIAQRLSSWPDLAVGIYLWALVIDHKNNTLTLVLHPALKNIKREKLLTTLDSKNSNKTTGETFYLHSPFAENMSLEEYGNAFQQIKSYINAGDCYQVNLTQSFTASYTGDLWLAYKFLRNISPTPYSAFLDYAGATVMSHSPERFIKLNQKKIETKPIKGTRPRYSCVQKDQLVIEELLSSEKDKAENLMIVDLLRNDLNKHCIPHSVKTTKLFSLESYANVHHLVSTIEGYLKETSTPVELLQDAFPGGSVTGAPKIRAMQIIRELETVARSVYCGAIGYISFNGNMETNIAIRTLIGGNNTLTCWGGGAIVADSNRIQEYEESLIKISNLTTSLEKKFLIRNTFCNEIANDSC